MLNIDSLKHAQGKSLFIDDIPVTENTLYATAITSSIAKGKIINTNFQKIKSLNDVIDVFNYENIPGDNQIGMIIQDEPLFAEDEVHFIGQPIALIIAKNKKSAYSALKEVEINYSKDIPITCPKEAYEKGSFISSPRTFQLGDSKKILKKAAYVFEGTVKSGGQEHLYLETQGAYSTPIENDCIKISSATQGPTAVQKIAARVLGISMHRIEVDVQRLGGGFGGKEDQATPWAVMTALAAYLLKRPVKYCLSRTEDINYTGKRHPYISDFKIGLSKDFKIIAFESKYYQNAGAAADLSPAIIERTLFHGTNAYFIPNVKLTAYSCKTNLPPNTAFRGFGAPQGVFVIESAIAFAAEKLNVPKEIIQEKNLIKNKDKFPYGQLAKNANAQKAWKQTVNHFNFKDLKKDIELFNKKNTQYKKGYSIMPICFGISFTNTVMNHARALIHIYQDGSIGISTGAIEMGQSVNTKLIQIAALEFSISKSKIKIETTNTSRVANTSPSAASSTADLNGKALVIACKKLKSRLIAHASKLLNINKKELTLKKDAVYHQNTSKLIWEKLIESAFLSRISLSAVGHYATPKIHFNKRKEKGHPFAYHVYGTSIITAKVDCLRGIAEIESVKIVHDFGQSINIKIDKGQVEGALLQSIGWVTIEDIVHNEKGQLLSNSLSTYKVPDIYSTPKSIDIIELKTNGHKLAIKKSKAVGEPPFIYGIGAYFAIKNAIKEFSASKSLNFELPITPEKILTSLHEL